MQLVQDAELEETQQATAVKQNEHGSLNEQAPIEAEIQTKVEQFVEEIAEEFHPSEVSSSMNCVDAPNLFFPPKVKVEVTLRETTTDTVGDE